MKELAGAAADGLFCSQAGIPPEAASKSFLDAYRKRFNAEPILYAPFTYDSANLLIEAMKKADSADPVKYLPALQKIDFAGATGRIAFDAKGDRKDAEMTIFTMKGGKLTPIAIIKGGRTVKYEDFLAQPGATGSGDGAKK
jgi:branched-chain amino acid transport system substrate-binding protein